MTTKKESALARRPGTNDPFTLLRQVTSELDRMFDEPGWPSLRWPFPRTATPEPATVDAGDRCVREGQSARDQDRSAGHEEGRRESGGHRRPADDLGRAQDRGGGEERTLLPLRTRVRGLLSLRSAARRREIRRRQGDTSPMACSRSASPCRHRPRRRSGRWRSRTAANP